MRNKRGTGIALSYVYLILNMVIGLFISSFIIRKLGGTEYGLYQTVGSFANYLVMLEFGTGTVMTRNLSVYRHDDTKERTKKCISTIWIISFALSLLIFGVATVFMLNMGIIYKNTMTLEQLSYGRGIFSLIVVNLVLSFFQSTANGMLLGFENYTFSDQIKILKLVIRTFIVVLMLSFWPLAIVLTIVDCLLSIVSLISTIIYCKSKYEFKIRIKDFDMQIFKESLPLCIALILQTLINQANNEVDKTVLGICLSLESVAVYSVAQYIYSMFSSVTTVPIKMYMPEVAKTIMSGSKGLVLTKTLIQPCRLITICGGMIMFGFIAVGKQFINVLYGEQYLPAWLYANIIIIPMFINMTNGVLVNVLDVLKKRMMRSYILLATTAINIFLTIILINRIGIIGAVIATAISVIIGQDIAMNIYYSKKIGIRIMYLFAEAYKGIIPAEVLACIVSSLVASLIHNSLWSLITGGIVFLFVCFIGFVCFGFNNVEKENLKKVLKKLKKTK